MATLTIREQQRRGNRDRPCGSSGIGKPRGRGRKDQRGSRENRNRGQRQQQSDDTAGGKSFRYGVLSLVLQFRYEPKTPEADASVDADTVNDATAFLETFFKLYPTATEKELTYYVLGNVIEPIGRDYLYSELVNPIFIKDGDNVKVKVAVKFLDNQTKATQVSQYELVLHKDSNWKIVG